MSKPSSPSHPKAVASHRTPQVSAATGLGPVDYKGGGPMQNTESHGLARLWRTLAAYGAAAVRRFLADQCLMRASALAYISLLSIVPLLALMFAVLKGLGVQHRLEPLLLSRLSLDQETSDLIIGYIDRTNVSTLGALGAATLVLTVVSVLGNVQTSFNAIWRVRR